MPSDSNNTNSSESGFYQPVRLPFEPLENYEEFINRTKPTLSQSVLDGIFNLINMLPNMYAEQTLLGGEDVIWLRRKVSGIPCPNIQNDTTEEQCEVSHCPLCFGTTWLGGYDTPLMLRMSFNPQKADIKIEQMGLAIQENPTAWTIDTDPIMKEMDLIVTYANERYLIQSQESETKQGHRVYQRLTLTRLDKYDVAYLVPVPSIYGDGHTDFQASIQINGFKQDFPAMIFIFNYLWYPSTGLNTQNIGE